MVRVESHEAPVALRAHVRRVWRIVGPVGAEDWLLPDVGGGDVAIHLGEPARVRRGGDWRDPGRLVTGGQGRALRLAQPAWVDTVGITLAPGCACLVGETAAALRDEVAALGELAPALDAALARWAAGARAARGALDWDGLWRVLAARLRPGCDGVATRAAALLAGEPRRVEAVARELGLSRRQLGRRFERAVGLPPRQFVRVARLARAWQMVAGAPPASWAEVAAAAGFADQAHLAREFRALVDATPTQVFSPAWYALVGA